ncbi:hypothetical protein [Kitasatospora camelliae]|uniref:Uncharacterized protein n=1 Tax=Kitasatospora camelliae TaxID=3156397 RepID=A0AAU8JQ62_9ACTN
MAALLLGALHLMFGPGSDQTVARHHSPGGTGFTLRVDRGVPGPDPLWDLRIATSGLLARHWEVDGGFGEGAARSGDITVEWTGPDRFTVEARYPHCVTYVFTVNPRTGEPIREDVAEHWGADPVPVTPPAPGSALRPCQDHR